MNKLISLFTQEPYGNLANNTKWKYGVIIICLLLVLSQIFFAAYRPYAYLAQHPSMIPTALFIHFLAFYFKFSKKVTIVLRIVAVLALTFCMLFYLYLFFLSG